MGIERRKLIAAVGATIVAASLAGFGASTYLGHAAAVTVKPKAPQADLTQAQYTCSMHPQILQDHPGYCPICNMALVKVANGEMVSHSDMVHVDLATQQRMGIALATAGVTDIGRAIHAYATIAPDESGTVSVNPRVEGWLRRVYVQGVGQTIHKGQPLYDIFSPELQQRQREYIDLLARKDGLLGDNMTIVSSNSAMVGSLSKEKFRTRDRLLSADMSADLIEQLEKSRRVIDVVTVRASHDGVVTALGMHEGNYVNPMQQILAYANYSTVWAEIALLPDQLEWIKQGDALTLHSGLDRTTAQNARVDLATLQIDALTRTGKLRLPLKNPNGAFRPGAFAEVDIHAGVRRALTIPRDAVIRTGHGSFVVVAEQANHFRSARIELGLESDDKVAVVSGIKAGDRVVINGQFMLDSAASMLALQARLDSTSGAAPQAGVDMAAQKSMAPMAAMPAMMDGHAGHAHAMAASPSNAGGGRP
ncbi:efflux RND transporter periplasmic adaptor subunit [Rugamonas sp.]|uniref:efflux RND transporter periplasmic adaptor subunit n=1 Tax=Rugamonas sp. TaxID=1926287 RepID=UPI0025F7EB81|nr:efflux RND transporter periplasmic adaptor subunit [Rugamonas sp.]